MTIPLVVPDDALALLVGVRERVAMLGGTVEAGPRDGRWRLSATIPLDNGSAGETG